MALIVVPLASALLWLGWHAVGVLEQRSVNQRMSALDYAVATTLTDGLRTIASVGLTLAEAPSFQAIAGHEADDERRRQLMAVLGRHPAVAAAYVGYPDGHFLYAGRLSQFSAERRVEFAAPNADAIVLRTVDGEGPARRETWMVAGAGGAPRSRPDSYDPRVRPWYVEAEARQAPILTEPYRFAWSTEPGISAGLPMRGGGVIGFDFTLGTLSRLMGDYKITPNTIVLISMGTSDVLIETDPCKADSEGCFPEDGAARKVLRQTVLEGDRGQRLTREVEAGGRDYKIFVHSLPAALGRPLTIAAAVPMEELSADSRVLLDRAAILAAVAVSLAIFAVLVTSLLVSRSTSRLAAKTERIRHLDFSDTVPVTSHITEIRRLSDAIERMREGLEVFGRYVSKDLVTQIMRSPNSTGLGGTRRDLTVMFTDIEGFSRISESIEPELLTSRLSRYFEALGAAISGNRGMIDKYIGDSVMAFWNAPRPIRTISPMPCARPCRQRTPAAGWRTNGASAAGRPSAPASACIPGRRWSAMSGRASASTTHLWARSRIRPPAWKDSTRSTAPTSWRAARSPARPSRASYGATSIASSPPARPRCWRSTNRWARSRRRPSTSSSSNCGGRRTRLTTKAASSRRWPTSRLRRA